MANIEMNYYDGSQYVALYPDSRYSGGEFNCYGKMFLRATSGTGYWDYGNKLVFGNTEDNEYILHDKIDSLIMKAGKINFITDSGINANGVPVPKRELLEYTGTGEATVTFSVKSSYPYFIIGGGGTLYGRYLSFGFAEKYGILSKMCSIDISYADKMSYLKIGSFYITPSSNELKFSQQSYGSKASRINIPQNGDNALGYGDNSLIVCYNDTSISYQFLIIK